MKSFSLAFHLSLFYVVVLMWFVFWLVLRSSDLILGPVNYKIVFILFTKILMTFSMFIDIHCHAKIVVWEEVRFPIHFVQLQFPVAYFCICPMP